ncbi:MAG: AI-2E family transporter [Bacillota bacterium]|nr:AI-2E family transporter [Bacillota bacterium]
MKPIDFTKLKISTLLLITGLVSGVVIVLTRTEIFDLLSKGVMPVLSAFALAYFMDYIVRGFQKYLRVGRGLGILLTLLFLVFVIYLAGIIILPSIADAVVSLYRNIVNTKFDFDRLSVLHLRAEDIEFIKGQITNAVLPMVQKLTDFTGSTIYRFVAEIGKFASKLVSAFVTLSIAVYILSEKNDLLARFHRMLNAYCSERMVKRVRHIGSLSDRIFKGFVIGKVVDSIIIGIICYILLLIFGFQYAILIAAIVGITNVIPYFGPIIGAVPAALITLIASYDDPIRVIYILLLILAIQQLDGIIIGPMILGDSVGVSPFWIIVSVTVGGATFGVIGMFLGVPTVVLIKTLIEGDVESRLDSMGLAGFEEEKLSKKGKR